MIITTIVIIVESLVASDKNSKRIITRTRTANATANFFEVPFWSSSSSSKLVVGFIRLSSSAIFFTSEQ